jgi:hypothetical protein
MEIQINKIKYERKVGQVSVEYDQICGDKADDIKIVLKSYDKPLPEFIDKLNELAPFVEKICELPEGYCSCAEIRGVSLSHTNDVLGAVITALIPIESANSPVVINTPHLPSEQYSESGQSPLLSPKCVFAIKGLIYEAERYINGERQKDNQTELEFNTEEEAA